jgi:hypothetical protein
MHRPCEALAATLVLQPLASTCCIGIETIVITTTPNKASAATKAIITIDVFVVVVISLFPLHYGWKQFPFDAKNACEPFAHPAASACWCNGIVTATITSTIPSTATAATMAIIAIDAFLSCSPDEWFIFVIN